MKSYGTPKSFLNGIGIGTTKIKSPKKRATLLEASKLYAVVLVKNPSHLKEARIVEIFLESK